MLLAGIPFPRVTPAGHLSHVGIIIPTWNAEKHWHDLALALSRQGLLPEQILIVDSSSTDGTVRLAKAAGYRVVQIPQSEFNHGSTRKAAFSYLPSAEILVLLTQDAILAKPDSIATLCSAFDDPLVGAAYGRQLPRPHAKAMERHARFFNYPAQSDRRTFEHRKSLGLKAAFLSNSFAAYRRSAMDAIGGFPTNVIVSEDLIAGAQMLMAGWTLAYVAEATVIHSHAFSLKLEFARYFDIGVNHAREPWLLEIFGDVGNEGRRFVISELKYLVKNDLLSLPNAIFHAGFKWIAYKVGTQEQRISVPMKRKLSAHPNFWKAGSARG